MGSVGAVLHIGCCYKDDIGVLRCEAGERKYDALSTQFPVPHVLGQTPAILNPSLLIPSSVAPHISSVEACAQHCSCSARRVPS
jgi:hypothetical protein